MRDDEETKAELHQRVDDLRVKLWDICDERKAQAEKERQAIIDDGWLDDHLGLLSNHYLTQMQGEVDRYQDTVRMLRDYYKGMDGHYPEELNANYTRIPLIEVRKFWNKYKRSLYFTSSLCTHIIFKLVVIFCKSLIGGKGMLKFQILFE